MRSPRLILWIASLILALHVQSQPVEKQYFPELAFDSNQQHNQFIVEWYAKNLRALEEPSLFDLSKDRKVHVYRFLWLRTFDKPIALRLILDPEGTGLLIKKVTDGAGGYEPGKLELNENVAISKGDIDKFLDLVEKVTFWKLPTKETTDVMGLDGAQWVIEGVHASEYHLVDRWSPRKSSPYRKLALYLVHLAKLEVKEVY